MNAILLVIARARSVTMRFVQNVAKTRLPARYPTSAVGDNVAFPSKSLVANLYTNIATKSIQNDITYMGEKIFG